MGAFHWRNGIHFERKPDKSVSIFRIHQAKSGTSTREDREDIGVIPAPEWASIVSSVSKDGETGDTFRAAHKFHTGEDFDAKPVEPVPAAAPAPKKPAKPKAK